MINLLNIYQKLPEGFKDSLKSAYGSIPFELRLGKSFKKQLKFLEKSQWWSEQELESYQNEQLRRLIHHAYNNVPFYNRLFKANHLTPKDISTVKDLPKLPILKKDQVRIYLSELRAVNFKDKDVTIISTGGTTGVPLRIYYEKSLEYLNNDPFVWRFFRWGGHRIGELRATLSNWTIGGDRMHSLNPVRNLLILSAYKLNSNNVEKYADLIKKHKIRFLDGYPSAIEIITRNMKSRNISRPANIEAIFTFAEYLSDWQRKVIEEFWGCKCFDRYSLEERCVMGAECEKHSGLHLFSDYGITEFTESNIKGLSKIIATSLINYAMPLIRYDTEDIGSLSSNKCSCRRGFPIFRLVGGRKKNFAVTKDNSYIPVANIDIPNIVENILQFQFIQEQRGSLVLNIVKKDTFSNHDLSRIKTKLLEKFGKNMDVDIIFTNSISKTNKNKTPIFIQGIKDETEYGIHVETEAMLL